MMRSLLPMLVAMLLASCGDKLLVSDASQNNPGQTLVIDYVSPRRLAGESSIILAGHGFKPNTKAMIDGAEANRLSLRADRMVIAVPLILPERFLKIELFEGEVHADRAIVLTGMSEDELHLTNLDPSQVCDSAIYLNASDRIVMGEQSCGDSPLPSGANERDSKVGALKTTTPDCGDEQEIDCRTNADFPAAHRLSASEAHLIAAGTAILGLEGKLQPCSTGGSDCLLMAASMEPIDARLVVPQILRSGATLFDTIGILQDLPAPCTAGGQLSCVARTAYPAIDAARFIDHKSEVMSSLDVLGVNGSLTACAPNGSNCYIPPYDVSSQPLKAIDATPIDPSVILQNSTIGGVTGILLTNPSVCSVDGGTACKASGGYAALDKAHAHRNLMRSTLTLGGITGLMDDCASDGSSACLATNAFPAVQLSRVNAGKSQISSDLTIGGVAGTLATCTAAASDCYLPPYELVTPQTLKAIDTTPIIPSHIRSGVTIASVTGSVIPTSSDCAGDGQTACVARTAFPALQTSQLTANLARLSNTLTIAGQTGALPDCSGENQGGCRTTDDYPAIDKDRLVTNLYRIPSTVSLIGETGALSDCGAGGSGCYIPPYAAGTQNLKAIDFDAITACNIKKGSTILGVTGDFPSSACRMSHADANAELKASTFNSQLTNSAAFSWFTSTGARLSAAGSNDIIPNNIRSGVVLFGVTGNVLSLQPWDVRYGVPYGLGNTGRLKMNCRDLADLSQWDASMPIPASWSQTTDLVTTTGPHGLAIGDTVQLVTTATSTQIQTGKNYKVSAVGFTTTNFKLTTDNDSTQVDLDLDSNASSYIMKMNGGSADLMDTIDSTALHLSPPALKPWGDEHACSGFDTTGSSDNIWKDVTSAGCNSLTDQCRFKDQITNLEWSRRLFITFPKSGMGYCNEMTYDGKADWRMPTIYEWAEAYSHGFWALNNAYWNPLSEKDARPDFYSATGTSWDIGWALISMDNGTISGDNPSGTHGIVCVRGN